MRLVCAALSAVVLVAGCTSGSGPEAQPSSTPSSTLWSSKGAHMTVTAPAPGDWRTEVWRDVQLEVPAGWAPGYAPVPDGDGALLCGVGPLESGGERGPYVGRPGYGSDMCLGVTLADLGLRRAGVWFGSLLPVGEVLAKTGLRQVTVEAGRGRVTVASKDDQVLSRVLGSVEQVADDAHGCPAEPDIERSYPDEGYGDARSLAVCVYQRNGDGAWQRLWTTSLPAAPATELVDAVDGAEAGPSCRPRDSDQLVLLRVQADDPMGDEPLTRDLVARPSTCASLQHWGTGAEWLGLTPELVRPWAVDGVRSYVWSNGLPRRLSRFFRPLWG